MPIYVIGHLNPDLDSVASSIVYSKFLRQLKRYKTTRIIPVAASPINHETEEVFSKIRTKPPKLFDDVPFEEGDRVILVDHNEDSQRHQKIKPEHILEIIDHHRANMDFPMPIRIDIEPCGSTASFIGRLYETYRLTPNKRSMLLMLTAILSDTQGLKSSTTTLLDTKQAHKMAKTLGLNLAGITEDLFKAKENIEGLTPLQVIKRDPKTFKFGGKKIFIGQIETLHPKEILEQNEKLVEALEKHKKNQEFDQAYVMVTDLGKEKSWLMYPSGKEREIVEGAFKTSGDRHVADIGPRMSRKRDVVPLLQ
jgi:manganese-dependent inorganic pyrophosphatase